MNGEVGKTLGWIGLCILHVAFLLNIMATFLRASSLPSAILSMYAIFSKSLNVALRALCLPPLPPS